MAPIAAPYCFLYFSITAAQCVTRAGRGGAFPLWREISEDGEML